MGSRWRCQEKRTHSLMRETAKGPETGVPGDSSRYFLPRSHRVEFLGTVELPLIWLPFLWEVGKTEKKRGKNPSKPSFG